MARRSAGEDRIFGWQDTQLSIAKYSGGITINGVEYVIAYHEEGEPLVKKTIFKKLERDERAKRKLNAEKRAEQRSLLAKGGQDD